MFGVERTVGIPALATTERTLAPDRLAVPFTAIATAGMRGAETGALMVAEAARIRVGGWSYPTCPNCPQAAELAPGGTWTSAVSHNVRDSEATLVFTFSVPNGPTRAALRWAPRRGKPALHVTLRPRGIPSADVIARIRAWIERSAGAGVLHITGSRHEVDPGIEQATADVLIAILEAA